MTKLLSAWGIEDMKVIGAKGKPIGAVYRVLFHPSEPRAVGFQIHRPRLGYVVERPDTYLALDHAEVSEDGITVPDKKKAWGKGAARRLGISWEYSVIWRGMPVLTESGANLGLVRDVLFGLDGSIDSMELSTGATGDAAVGCREIKGEWVDGFHDDAVRVSDEAAKVEFSGGAAAAAGRGTAVAANAATQAAKAAVVYGRAAADVARSSETGKKAMSWLKRAKDATVEAMQAPDDEDEQG